MNKKISTLLLLCLSVTLCEAQIVYEKGYLVDNQGKKVDCLIRNMDWLNNPVKFEFKLSENAERKTAVIDSVAEFGVEGSFKYLRRDLKIDTSSSNLRFISANRNPEYNEQQVFLKVLEEGEASLYMYRWGVETRYFYSFEDNREVSQLIFKQYKNRQGGVATNEAYKQQLFFLTRCEDIKPATVEKVYYGEKELMKLFRRFNRCGQDTPDEVKEKGWEWHLGLRAGVSSAFLDLTGPVNSSMKNTRLERKFTPRYGLESELILPINKKKWAVALEVTHLQYNSTATIPENPNVMGLNEPYYLEGEFNYLNYVLGIRHFFYLSNRSKLFLAPYWGSATSLTSKIDFKRANGQKDYSIPVETSFSFGLGAGYKLRDRLSLEIRYMRPRVSLFGLYYYSAGFNETNLTLGYNLF